MSARRASPRSQRLVRKTESLALTRGHARIAVVADTHSAPHPRAEELLARERPDRILHAGDIGDLDVLRRLEKIAPTWAVRGNIDERGKGLPDALRIDVLDEGARSFGMLLFHIALAGPRIRADAARLAREEGANVVVCGHSHVPFLGIDKGMTLFNPGSIGPRRFHLPIVFGVLEVSPQELAMRHIDCETGEVWLP